MLNVKKRKTLFKSDLQYIFNLFFRYFNQIALGIGLFKFSGWCIHSIQSHIIQNISFHWPENQYSYNEQRHVEYWKIEEIQKLLLKAGKNSIFKYMNAQISKFLKNSIYIQKEHLYWVYYKQYIFHSNINLRTTESVKEVLYCCERDKFGQSTKWVLQLWCFLHWHF